MYQIICVGMFLAISLTAAVADDAPQPIVLESVAPTEISRNIDSILWIKNYLRTTGRDKLEEGDTKSFGIVLPAKLRKSANIYSSPKFSKTIGVVKPFEKCEILELEERSAAYAKVACKRVPNGYIQLENFAYSVFVQSSQDRQTYYVSWQHACGADSCQTQSWIFSKKGWRRYLGTGYDRYETALSPNGRNILLVELATASLYSPERPRLWLEQIITGVRRLLADGVAPVYHPSGRFIIYRTMNGSVFAVTPDGESLGEIYCTAFQETEDRRLYVRHTTDAEHQEPVTFLDNEQIRIPFRFFNGMDEAIAGEPITIKLPEKLHTIANQ